MEAEIVNILLSGAGAHTSRLGRASLAIIFCVRLAALGIGVKTLWSDEERDFICNSTRESCHSGCFDTFSPLSPFNLFTFQLVILFTHALALASYSRQDITAKGRWPTDPFRGRMGHARLHFLFLLAKAIIEIIFIITFYQIYGGLLRPRTVNCQQTLCEEHVVCLIQNTAAKNCFNVFMLAASLVCVLLCLFEISGTALNIYRNSWHHERPLMAQKATV